MLQTIKSCCKQIFGIDARALAAEGLALVRRKGNNFEESEIELLIRREVVEGPGRLAGYRNIWHAPGLRHHVHVPRSLVARLMKKIDPDSVQERRATRLTRRNYLSPGPNFCCHMDGKIRA